MEKESISFKGYYALIIRVLAVLLMDFLCQLILSLVLYGKLLPNEIAFPILLHAIWKYLLVPILAFFPSCGTSLGKSILSLLT